jgi:hypothetical protein
LLNVLLQIANKLGLLKKKSVFFLMLDILGSMVQVRRLGVHFLMALDFLIDLILPATLLPWSRLGVITEVCARNIPWGKRQPSCKADNLTATFELIAYKI